VETKLVAIGNSQGVRLPKAIVEAAGVGLDQPLRVEVQSGRIVLTPVRALRSGWAEAAREAAGDRMRLWGGLPAASRLDEDWTW
jgi:antitoxin MazE